MFVGKNSDAKMAKGAKVSFICLVCFCDVPTSDSFLIARLTFVLCDWCAKRRKIALCDTRRTIHHVSLFRRPCSLAWRASAKTTRAAPTNSRTSGRRS